MRGRRWMRRAILGAGLVAGVALGSRTGVAQDEWPMFQANPSHTGFVAVTIDPASIELRWAKEVTTSRLNPIAAADGTRDTVRCGKGRDRVVADRVDRVSRDCERVKRRR